MRVLIIKTSSMGDVIHTLPALTDAMRAFPTIQFDWVVEENFVEIPKWHPAVETVIPVALRRWRKTIFSKKTREEWRFFQKQLQQQSYDYIIDAQGLLKSAFLTLLANGQRAGGDWHSTREASASLFYQKKYAILQKQHAVDRTRELFSKVLNYSLEKTMPDYGIDRTLFMQSNAPVDYLVFLHGTTWDTKHWPEDDWLALAKKAEEAHVNVKLLWGTEEERLRAERIASQCKVVEVMPRLNLANIASLLAGAKAIVAVDTGLGHLAAALNVPTISLYGPTDALLTGTKGEAQLHLSATFACAPCLNRVCSYPNKTAFSKNPPCFTTILPEEVFAAVTAQLE